MIPFIIGFIVLVFLIGRFLPGLRYPVSTVKASDGHSYIVRDLGDKNKAADNLAKIRAECFRLKEVVIQKYPDDPRSIRLKKNLTEERTVFTESTPDSNFTSHTKNKGEAIVFCLRQRNEKEELVDMNTMMFVAIHEMGHIASETVGHNDEFWTNFKWLLEIAIANGFYKSVDYKQDPQEYCGMMITDNPAID